MDKFTVKRSRLETKAEQTEQTTLVICQADDSSSTAADTPVCGDLTNERDADAISVSGTRVTLQSVHYIKIQ